MNEPTPAVVLRARHDSDLPACAAALADVHARDGYPVNWPADPAGWLTTRTLIGAWVAELDGRVVGHVGLSGGTEDDIAPRLLSDRAAAPLVAATGVVSRLFVAPGARGHRIGALLMARVVAEARTRQLRPVLDVVATDTAAVALYERLGWELLGTAEEQWGPEQKVTLRAYHLAAG
ncbi:GNAT family N-acetyltransferase [Streptomyces sp. NBC_00370]|uniref:GNAT family N-acetyltransferase n=1 Tax=Streptomyces sp. NBC_00370 TaxID=2975728 RepID=UPI002E256689